MALAFTYLLLVAGWLAFRLSEPPWISTACAPGVILACVTGLCLYRRRQSAGGIRQGEESNPGEHRGRCACVAARRASAAKGEGLGPGVVSCQKYRRAGAGRRAVRRATPPAGKRVRQAREACKGAQVKTRPGVGAVVVGE